MEYLNTTIRFLRNNWLSILSGAGVAVVIVALTILTTRTDAISTTDDIQQDSQTVEETENEVIRGIQTNSPTTSSSSAPVQTSSSTSSSNESESVPSRTHPYDVDISAESAIVWDTETKTILFSKAEQKEQPLASLTKLMTALVASRKATSSSAQTVISREHLRALGNTGLIAGQTWKLTDLIAYMLMESSNDAARAVAAASGKNQADGYAKEFIDAMNKMARQLNLESTYFFNPSGLDLNETLISGGYGSARDIAELFGHILQTNPELLEPTTKSSTVFTSMEGREYPARNTNTWLSRFSNTLGSKTGYTVLAGGNLVMGFDLEHPVVIVVMGSTKEGRFSDMETLFEATKRYFKQ